MYTYTQFTTGATMKSKILKFAPLFFLVFIPLFLFCEKAVVVNVTSNKISDQGLRVYNVYEKKFNEQHYDLNKKLFSCDREVLEYYDAINSFGKAMGENVPEKDLRKTEKELFKPKTGVDISKVVKPCWSYDGKICIFTQEIEGIQNTVFYYIFDERTNNVYPFFRYSYNKQFDYVEPEADDIWAYTYPYAISIDKRYIVFTAMENKQWDLWLFCRAPKTDVVDYFATEDFDSGENQKYLLKLTNDQHREIAPEFNINGDKIIYTVLINGKYEIREWDLINMMSNKLFRGKDNYIYARYAPYRGKSGYEKICYVVESQGKYSLNIMQKKSGLNYTITKNIPDCRIFPTWCPNEKHHLIAYYYQDTIKVFDFNKRLLNSLIENVAKPVNKFYPSDLGPQWTLGGNYIIYLKKTDCEENAVIDIFGITKNFGTKKLHQPAKGSNIREISVGGKNVAFVQYSNIYSQWQTIYFGIKKKIIRNDKIREEKIYLVKLKKDSLKWKENSLNKIKYVFGQVIKEKARKNPYEAVLANSKGTKYTESISCRLNLNKQYKCLRFTGGNPEGDLRKRDKNNLMKRDINIYVKIGKGAGVKKGDYIYIIPKDVYNENRKGFEK